MIILFSALAVSLIRTYLVESQSKVLKVCKVDTSFVGDINFKLLHFSEERG